MTEFIRQIITSWYAIPTTVLLMFVAAGLYSFWWNMKSRLLPKGYVAIEAAERDRLREDYQALCKRCFDQSVELDDLKAKPRPDRMTPVIDWVTMNAIYTDYDAELHEFEIGWLNGKGDMGHSTLNEISQGMAIQLNEEFKLWIKTRHQPARFA